MKITKARLKTLIKEEFNKELAADFVENDIVDYLIKIGAIEGPNDEGLRLRYGQSVSRCSKIFTKICNSIFEKDGRCYRESGRLNEDY